MADVMTIHAKVKGVRQSPRKVGLIAALVRGRSVSDALTILEHTPKRAALPVVKVIKSAKANATNKGLTEASLQLTQVQVTAGPRLRRYNPAAFGRALPYQKRSSHILVEVTGEAKPKKPAAKKADVPAAKEEKN